MIPNGRRNGVIYPITDTYYPCSNRMFSNIAKDVTLYTWISIPSSFNSWYMAKL